MAEQYDIGGIDTQGVLVVPAWAFWSQSRSFNTMLSVCERAVCEARRIKLNNRLRENLYMCS